MSAVTLMLLVNNAPAPAAVLAAVQELSVTTSVDAAGAFRLRLGLAPGEDGSWPLLDPALFPPGASVRIGVAVDSPLPTFLLVGYVASQSVQYGDEHGNASVEIGGVDATALMNLAEKTVAWPNLPDALIATQVFASYGLVPSVTATGPVLVDPEGTTMQRSSDIRFLRHLAWRNGFTVYTLPEPHTGLEVGHFGPLDPTATPAATLAVRAGDATGVTHLQIRQDMLAPTTAVADALDLRHSAQNAHVEAVSATVGQTSTLSRLPHQPVVRLTGTGLTASADLQRAAQAEVDRASYVLVAEGVTAASIGPLRPGDVVTLAGTGAAYGGPWLIRGVRHVITPGAYVQRFTAVRNAIGSGLAAAVGG